MLPIILLLIFAALTPHSGIEFANLEDAQTLERQIHEAMTADGAIQDRWCEILERETLWFKWYAVVIEKRVEKYLTPEQLSQVGILSDAYFPEPEED